MNPHCRIALVGNPNTGKTTVFNALTGLHQKIGNYPGITVERKTGFMKTNGRQVELIDLPGLYSMNPKSADEQVAYGTLLGNFRHESRPDAVILVLDATNLERNLYLASQILDLGLPSLILLNMIDVARSEGLHIDTRMLSRALGVSVLPMNARSSRSISELRTCIAQNRFSTPEPMAWNPSIHLLRALLHIEQEWIEPHTTLKGTAKRIESLRLLANESTGTELVRHPHYNVFRKVILEAREMMDKAGANWMAEEVLARYAWIEWKLGQKNSIAHEKHTLTDRLDTILTHKVWGPVFFLGALLMIFQAIFSWSAPFMDLIEQLFLDAGRWTSHTLPEGMINDLLSDGIIAGLSGVMIFLPQILILFFFISLLEGTGYMSRAAFLMDGFMASIGLHGRSVVPLMSGFACAVPGVMATRTIENWRERLITMMVLPFIPCSARLPVYALLIGAFIPGTSAFLFFTWQGITFFGLYFFGMIAAIIASLIFNAILPHRQHQPFIMELPAYKWPHMRNVFQSMLERGWVFIKEAGRIIMAVSIVLWFLASYPKSDSIPPAATEYSPAGMNGSSAFTHIGHLEPASDDSTQCIPPFSPEAWQLRNSYAGQIGRSFEPLISPLGFDWKIGIGLLTSFAAREVMVGTLSTIYSLQADGDEPVPLRERLAADIHPDTGKPVFTPLVALSLLLFFSLAMQCMSTLAVVKRETNTWKWPAIMFVYMTSMAWIISFIVYQAGSLMGF